MAGRVLMSAYDIDWDEMSRGLASTTSLHSPREFSDIGVFPGTRKTRQGHALRSRKKSKQDAAKIAPRLITRVLQRLEVPCQTHPTS
ncbi:hypothetical protein GX51_01295 [Blastomyces parvus]|uniref:Uncharacterized protein n=1 Tax=Blastomyces parvus TaxID=2060905 RepID=A0A2B7XHF5_9EURO|nr:hypothetical protein GX51_01295 [Blastomyces parvus]